MAYTENKFKEYDLFLQIHDMYKKFDDEEKYFNKNILPINPESYSLYSNYTEHFRSVFLIACANSYEQFFENKLPSVFGFTPDSIHYNFLISQALKRKYFTMFDWDKKNANKFYSLFGESFKESMILYKQENTDFSNLERSFLELGQRRNILVHQGLKAKGQVQEVCYIYELFKKSFDFCHTVFFELDRWITIERE